MFSVRNIREERATVNPLGARGLPAGRRQAIGRRERERQAAELARGAAVGAAAGLRGHAGLTGARGDHAASLVAHGLRVRALVVAAAAVVRVGAGVHALAVAARVEDSAEGARPSVAARAAS